MTVMLAGAIDLGGTKILSVVAGADGRVLGSDRRPTEIQGGQDAIIAGMAASLAAAAQAAGVEVRSLCGLGVAVAGPIDVARQLLTDPPNLPFKNVPLGELLNLQTGLPVLLENDASAAAAGEHAFGAGRGVRDLVYLTVSTGVGGGVVSGDRLISGATGAAGEIGHLTVQPEGRRCSCGRLGCLEAYSSGTGIAGLAAEAVALGQGPRLMALAAQHDGLQAESVMQAAAEGDAAAAEVLATAARYLGIGLVSVVHLFNPALVIIGGGVAKNWQMIIAPAEDYLRRHAFASMIRGLRVLPAELGDDASALGAAALVLRRSAANGPASIPATGSGR